MYLKLGVVSEAAQCHCSHRSIRKGPWFATDSGVRGCKLLGR